MLSCFSRPFSSGRVPCQSFSSSACVCVRVRSRFPCDYVFISEIKCWPNLPWFSSLTSASCLLSRLNPWITVSLNASLMIIVCDVAAWWPIKYFVHRPIRPIYAIIRGHWIWNVTVIVEFIRRILPFVHATIVPVSFHSTTSVCPFQCFLPTFRFPTYLQWIVAQTIRTKQYIYVIKRKPTAAPLQLSFLDIILENELSTKWLSRVEATNYVNWSQKSY